MKMQDGAGSRGFTLVELLVVIAIITILAALLMPVLAKAMNAARLASCASNIRQIALVSRLYEDDHGGAMIKTNYDESNWRWPWTRYLILKIGAGHAESPKPGDTPIRWPHMRELYDNGALLCPGFPAYRERTGASWKWFSYGRNEYIGSQSEWTDGIWRKIYYFKQPERVFEWACHIGSHRVAYYYEPLSFMPWELHPVGRAPIAFLDGHAKPSGVGDEDNPTYRGPLANGQSYPWSCGAHPWQ